MIANQTYVMAYAILVAKTAVVGNLISQVLKNMYLANMTL